MKDKPESESAQSRRGPVDGSAELDRLRIEAAQAAELYNHMHDACDQRDKLAALVREVMSWHADPNSADYNECDREPCLWCQSAAAALPPNDP